MAVDPDMELIEEIFKTFVHANRQHRKNMHEMLQGDLDRVLNAEQTAGNIRVLVAKRRIYLALMIGYRTVHSAWSGEPNPQRKAALQEACIYLCRDLIDEVLDALSTGERKRVHRPV